MSEPAETPQPPEGPAPSRGGAVVVAAGILSSRLVGLLRNSVLAHYFGVGAHVDVLNMALRAPNFLQNLLGEGTLSAAFIPIYSRLLHAGREEDARRFAGAIFGLLAAVAGALSLLGVLLARPLTAVLAMGFLKDAGAVNRFELTVAAVRIIFPMTTFLVLSAWALGVLNSHRRFFLPYFAPVLWNAAIVAGLVWAGGWGAGSHPPLAFLDRLLFAACWGALVGGLLQFLVQLPQAWRLTRGFRPTLAIRAPGVGEALGAFGPVLAGRGVVQLAGYLDYFLAGFLAAGAVAALGFAQVLYMLPISLFGMSVAASELPELARLGSGEAAGGRLTARVRRSLAQMAFLNVPTFAGYLAFGYLLVAALLRRGSFEAADNWLVYLVLCGYTLGLLATTSSRLLQNTFYALGETRAPARIAALRVAVSAVLGVPLMLVLDRYTVSLFAGGQGDAPLHLGAAGLAAASGVGAWLELFLLRRALAAKDLTSFLPVPEMAKMTGLAVAAAAGGALVWWLLPPWPAEVQALLVLGAYAGLYLALARLAGLAEIEIWIGGLKRRVARR